MAFLRDLLANHIREVVGFSHPIRLAGLAPQHDTAIAAPPRSMTHAEGALVPGHKVNDVETCFVQPVADLMAQVKLVHPQEQVPGRVQGPVDCTDAAA